MKTFTIATIVALASVGAAQLNNIPSCALNCFVGPLTSDGCSSLTDFACHCKKGAELLSQVQPCVKDACSPSDQAAAVSAVQSTCAAAGAPINIPDASAPAASSAVASATSAASSAAASATSAAASAVSSIASSIASEASSVLSEASSAVASAASSKSAAVSKSMTATPTASGSISMTPSASLSEFTGAAAQATQAVGILGAAALALLAL